MNLTGRHTRILMQSLGVNCSESRPSRSHYFADCMDDDEIDHCDQLMRAGYMTRGGIVHFPEAYVYGTDGGRYGDKVITGKRGAVAMRLYRITPEGVEAIDGSWLRVAEGYDA